MKWAAKLSAKLVLSRFPLPYKMWRAFGVFRHGRMDSTEYALKIFRHHTKHAFPTGIPGNLTLLELGPGDSAASALIAYASQAQKIYLIDTGDFATHDVKFYRTAADKLRKDGLDMPDLSRAKTFQDVLTIAHADYRTGGLKSLEAIPTGSVDFIWSHSVLEHIRKHELVSTLRELKRILRPGGLSSHNIDYQDHLDHSLNSLRFSERLWESPFFAGSGFYTNRVPAVRLHQLFRDAGFTIRQEDFGRWDQLPLRRQSLHREFQQFQEDELINRTSYVLLAA